MSFNKKCSPNKHYFTIVDFHSLFIVMYVHGVCVCVCERLRICTYTCILHEWHSEDSSVDLVFFIHICTGCREQT